jgi:hypothetical protein
MRNVQDELNRLAPAAAHGGLGDIIYDLITAVNANITALKAIAAKLDADTGVTDTNYASTNTASLATIKTLVTRAASRDAT